jgi:RHS repeat-associated protein
VSSTDPTAAGITYDDRGNATKVGTASLTYDAMNLLTSATDGATTVEFARSSEGSIIGRSTTDAQGPGTIRYASQGLVLDDQGRVLAQGFELPGGVLVSRGSDGALTWTHTSLSGDRFFVLNDAGAQVGSVSGYSPFGEQIIGEKPVASDVSVGWQATNSADSLGMTTGLVVMGQRVYVPSLGRFIQIDPVVSGSANSYDFANQDPTSFKDPTGRAAEDSTWLITGIASVLLAIGTLAVSVKATAGMTKLFGAVKGRIYGGLVGGAAGLVIGGVAAGTGLALGLDPTQALTIVGTSVLAGVAGGAFIKKSGAAKLASSSGRNSDEVAGAGARSPRAAVRGEEAAALFAPQVPVPKVATVVPQRLKITPPSEQVSVYRLWANPRTGRLL